MSKKECNEIHYFNPSNFFGAQPTLKADVKNWTLEQVGVLNIDKNEEDYGGFSGLIIHKQGSEALLVTDKSFYFVLELLRNEDDNLTGFSVFKERSNTF